MIDEALQELVIQHVLGELDSAQTMLVHARLLSDPELRKFEDEIRESFASIAFMAKEVTPPGNLAEVILRQEKQLQVEPKTNIRFVHFAPWALAACLAVTAGLLGLERSQREKDIVFLKDQVSQAENQVELFRAKNAETQKAFAALQQQNHFSEMQIAMLKSQVAAYQQVTAVVLWDKEQRKGLIQLDKFPPAGSGKDYQLWVIDPNKPQPVSAGLLSIKDGSLTRANFTPVENIDSAKAFAISVEPSGGSQTPRGQIVLVGS